MSILLGTGVKQGITMTLTFKALPTRNTHSNEMVLHANLSLSSYEDECLSLQQPLCPSGDKSQHTVDDRASKQKETRLNECERLQAPKQFPCSGQGFLFLILRTYFQSISVHRGKNTEKIKIIKIKLIVTVWIMAPFAGWHTSEASCRRWISPAGISTHQLFPDWKYPASRQCLSLGFNSHYYSSPVLQISQSGSLWSLGASNGSEVF